jgi:hypothetical protein
MHVFQASEGRHFRKRERSLVAQIARDDVKIRYFLDAILPRLVREQSSEARG